ncbi:MAG: protein translocase subunit SecDF [Bacteroidota bacterium]
MQNKGAIKLFTIVLALVCIYQLTFTGFTQKVERDARKYAQGDAVKERFYLDSMKSEVVYNFLWIKKYTYLDCKEREINMGLDLRGGMNVILEIAVEDIIKSLAAPQYLTDPVFTEALKAAKEKSVSSQEDFVDLFAEAFEAQNPGGQMAQFFMRPENRGDIDFNTSNEQVIDYLKTEAQNAIDNSYNVLRNRIDKFGVVQLNLQKLERQGRILVELPGVKEPERVTKLLTGTANLEFWTTYSNTEVWQNVEEANRALATILNAESLLGSETPATETPAAETAAQQPETAAAAGEEMLIDTTGLFNVADSSSLMADQEAEFRRENPLFWVMRPYADNSGNLIESSVIGVVQVKDTALVNKYLAMPQIRQIFPSDLRFAWHFTTITKESNSLELHVLKSRNGQPALSGKYVTEAREDVDQMTGEYEVSMSMNAEGAKKWANLTRENVGKSIAIVLDGLVYSAPNVREEIKGGSSSISGNFTQNDATDLANILKSGKMPARARVESSEVIGPSLGAKSVKDGFNSFLIAFVIVLVYMLFYYSRRAGWVADLALLMNVFFLIGILASLQAALTLPGIAGIVLTLGMAVDANVLIYERIREELAAGKGLKLAVKDGYHNAYSAIIDGNVTTFLTGLILFFVGTGPIKGFATTLVIGIITSLFTGVVLTRIIYERWMDKNRTLTFATKFTENAFKNVKIDFIGARKVAYVISGLIILASIVSLSTRGLSKGVDFAGGRNYVVSFKHDVQTAEVRDLLDKAFGEMPTVITYGQKNTVRITTKYLIENDQPEADSIIKAKMFEGLKPLLDETVVLDDFLNGQDYIVSAHKVGPTIAGDIKKQAVIAVIFSLIVIFLYILIRFRNWQYGLGAIAALAHDVIITIGLFSMLYGIMPFSLEIDQAFIAAILTVVGYSINDTVIIFDRIREYLGLQKKRERKDVLNAALNSTLSRTFSTSFSTFIVVLVIFLFGGDVIRGFTFALMIGILVGTYSSVFIATPIMYDTLKKEEKSIEKK